MSERASGYELWNSETLLGRALRNCFPGDVQSLDIHLEPDEVPTVTVRYQMPEELRNVDWTQFFFDSEKEELGGVGMDVVSAKTGRKLTLSLTRQQAEQLAEFVKQDSEQKPG